MNETPKVTVIMPVYNTGEFLREALDSVLSQTLKDIEVIAVNDGSTDDSGEVLDSYAGRITVISKPNAGQAAARNDALDIARGKYVYFMDSDDWIDSDTLERCYDLCEKDCLDFAFFDAVSFGDGATGSLWQDYHRAASYPGIWKGTDLMLKMLQDKKYKCSVCMSLFNRSFLERIGARFKAGIIHEDELYSALVYFNAERVESVDAEFYHRRVRGESTMTRKFSKRNVDGYLTVIDSAANYVNSVPSGKAYKSLVCAIMLSLMHNGYSLPFSQKTRIAKALLKHPYSFRLKPFCVFLFKRFL